MNEAFTFSKLAKMCIYTERSILNYRQNTLRLLNIPTSQHLSSFMEALLPTKEHLTKFAASLEKKTFVLNS